MYLVKNGSKALTIEIPESNHPALRTLTIRATNFSDRKISSFNYDVCHGFCYVIVNGIPIRSGIHSINGRWYIKHYKKNYSVIIDPDIRSEVDKVIAYIFYTYMEEHKEKLY